MFQIKTGDIFKSTDTYLCHQCNCVTNKSAHLAKAVFTKYPYADVYTERVEPSKPGTIEVRGNGEDQRFVVAMFAQYYPGRTKYPNSKLDGWSARRANFIACLMRMERSLDIEASYAFPYGIGCGAAGGDWKEYLWLLQEFEQHIKGDVTIYQLEALKPKDPEPTLF